MQTNELRSSACGKTLSWGKDTLLCEAASYYIITNFMEENVTDEQEEEILRRQDLSQAKEKCDRGCRH